MSNYYNFNNPSYTRHAIYLKNLFESDMSITENRDAIERMDNIKKGEPKSGIYVILNIKTGDYYVGGSVHVGRRKMYHYYGMRTGIGGSRLLRKHAIKYGIENFKMMFIHSVKEEHMIEAEQFWIDSLDPFYNTTKISYRRASVNGVTKRLSDNYAKYGANYRSTRKKINQYSLDGTFIKEWNSITEATKELNTSSGCLSAALKKGTKSCGFRWKYV